jgi:hypothetical protein
VLQPALEHRRHLFTSYTRSDLPWVDRLMLMATINAHQAVWPPRCHLRGLDHDGHLETLKTNSLATSVRSWQWQVS